MKEIYFKTDDNISSIKAYENIVVKYQDKSLFSINGGGNGILIADSGLELFFDLETKHIGGIGGYLGDLSSYISTNINLNENQESAVLYFDSKEEFLGAVAYSFRFNKNIQYDFINSILVFGEYVPNKKLFKIFKNAFVQLSEQQELLCVLITGLFS